MGDQFLFELKTEKQTSAERQCVCVCVCVGVCVGVCVWACVWAWVGEARLELPLREKTTRNLLLKNIHYAYIYNTTRTPRRSARACVCMCVCVSCGRVWGGGAVRFMYVHIKTSHHTQVFFSNSGRCFSVSRTPAEKKIISPEPWVRFCTKTVWKSPSESA